MKAVNGRIRCDGCHLWAPAGFVLRIYVNTARRSYEVDGHICAECYAHGVTPTLLEEEAAQRAAQESNR